jgi:hypothetical protein
VKVETKVERFQTRGLFWRLVVLNIAISKDNSFSCDHFEPFLLHQKSLLCMLNWFFVCFQDAKITKRKKTLITKIQGCFAQFVDI